MSTTELKNIVLKKLESVNQAYLLEEILNLINVESSNDDIFKIPDEHKTDLEISLKQKQQGKTIPNAILSMHLDVCIKLLNLDLDLIKL